jgi:AcrR family transcriptional regulator
MARPKTISDEDLLDIAKECFLEGGPQVPTRVIAEKVGISQPALFKRFKNKEELFMAAIATKDVLQLVVDNITWLSTHPKEAPFQPQLEELLERLWRMLLELVPRMIAMYTHKGKLDPLFFLKSFKKPPPVKMLEALTGFVKRAQQNRQIQQELDPGITAMNIMGTLQGRLFFRQILGETASRKSDEQYIHQTARTLCEGLLVDGEKQ